jgi:RNA polymerase sigma-70 factor (ECF subfamily)
MRIAIALQKNHWRNRRIQFWKLTHTNSMEMEEARHWLANDETAPEKRVLAREQVRQVWKAVEEMKNRQRSAFLLHYVEDLKVSEIALATGMNESTVKTHLY